MLKTVYKTIKLVCRPHCIINTNLFSLIKCSALPPVKLNPPTNLTVQNGSDCNLGFYWKQNYSNCVRSEVRYRINNKNWKVDNLKKQKKKHYQFMFVFESHLTPF